MEKKTIFTILLVILAIALFVVWKSGSSVEKVHSCTLQDVGKTCINDNDCTIGNFSGVCNLASLNCELVKSSFVNKSECLSKGGKYR